MLTLHNVVVHICTTRTSYFDEGSKNKFRNLTSFSMSIIRRLPSIASTVMVVDLMWRSVCGASFTQGTFAGHANGLRLGNTWCLLIFFAFSNSTSSSVSTTFPSSNSCIPAFLSPSQTTTDKESPFYLFESFKGSGTSSEVDCHLKGL